MAGGESFKSFISNQQKRQVDTYPQCSSGKIPLLNGELRITECDDVGFAFQFQDFLQGSLVCTNFCLYFQPDSPPLLNSRMPQRLLLLDEQYTIPICSIRTVAYSPHLPDLNKISSRKKFRKVVGPVSTTQEAVCCIKLYLKDFRVLTLDMQLSQNAPNLINTLGQFMSPSNLDNVIQNGALESWNSKNIPFNDDVSWRKELERCQAQQDWRVCKTQFIVAHRSIASYPMSVVIPQMAACHELGKVAENCTECRFPIWVWSFPNGSSLLRASTFEDIPSIRMYNNDFLNSITLPPSNGGPPYMMTLDPATFSIDKVSSAYEKLGKLCSIDSRELFIAREKDWLTRVSDTGWLHLVSSCLSKSAEVIRWLHERRRSVVIYEDSGVDLSAVISSITQICCDRYYRTFRGFETLIDKDWIALGHPFGLRNLGIGRLSDTAPTFLLFLDCVAQLIRLYPTQFEYSEHLPIGLWDLSLLGIVPGFTCSSVDEQLATRKKGGPFPLSRWFTVDYENLFLNISFQAANNVDLMIAKTGGSRGTNSGLIRCEILRPPTSLIDVELWNLCYLRWIPPANVKNGGSILRDFALEKKINGAEWNRHFHELTQNKISSSFPYSLPDTELSTRLTKSEASDAISISSFSSVPASTKIGRSASVLSHAPVVSSFDRFGAVSYKANTEVVELRPAAQIMAPVRPAPLPPGPKPVLRM